MKKLISLCVFALASAAVACPVKSGYIANGIVRNVLKPKEFVPMCSLQATLQKQFFSTMRWTEVYGVENSNLGRLNIAYVITALKEKGFKQVASQPTEKGNVWRFDKGSQVVMVMTAANGPVIFLAIAGR